MFVAVVICVSVMALCIQRAIANTHVAFGMFVFVSAVWGYFRIRFALQNAPKALLLRVYFMRSARIVWPVGPMLAALLVVLLSLLSIKEDNML